MDSDERRAGDAPDPSNNPSGSENLGDAHVNQLQAAGMDPLDIGDVGSSDDEDPQVDMDYLDDYDADVVPFNVDEGDDSELTSGEAQSMPLLAADFYERGVSIRDALLRFNRVFRARYKAMPETLEFFPGTLAEAVEEAFPNISDGLPNDGSHLPATERRLLLLYLHTDDQRSIARNMFADRVFANELIVGLLTERCILWGWDVSASSNMALLKQMINAGLSKKVWKSVESVLPHQYPLLIVVKGRGCSATTLARADSDYAETAERLCNIIDGLGPLTGTEREAQIESDAEMARRLDEKERAKAAWFPRLPEQEPPRLYTHGSLANNVWVTSPPYPDDESIPLWRDERGCVDDRRLVKAGLEGVQPPPADARSAHVVVKFNNVNVIAPRQVTYEHLTFHDHHMSLFGSKNSPFGITIAYSDVQRLFFLRGDELRIGYFMIQYEEDGEEEFVVMKLYRVQEAVKMEVDLGAAGGVTLPRDFVDAVNGGSLSAEEAPIFERIAGVLQLLCRKPLIVSHGFAAENAKPLIFCSIPASTGFLYPLDAGLAFISIAPHFISYDEIADNGVELQEMDGKPDTMVITVTKKDGTRLNYSNLHQQDAALLKTYLDGRAADGWAR